MRQRQQRLLIVLFLLPSIAVYTLFAIYPVFSAFKISLCDWRGFSALHFWNSFVGLANYKLVFMDRIFWSSIRNCLLIIVIPTSITIALALYFASVLARGVRGANLYRVTYYFPNILSMVVTAVMWSFIYHPKVGILNGFINLVGKPFGVHVEKAWLSSDTLIGALYPFLVWGAAGFFVLLYLAAIQRIPEELYDAAKVDGANQWRIFWNVTFPLVWPVHRIVAVFAVIGGLKFFDAIWVFSYGVPALSNHSMATWMYQKAFTEYDLGYGTALAVVMFVLVFAASLVTLRLTQREVVAY